MADTEKSCESCRFWENNTSLDDKFETGFCSSEHWKYPTNHGHIRGDRDIYFALKPDGNIVNVETGARFCCCFYELADRNEGSYMTIGFVIV